jgi:choline dehydrogenase-like flavoprotein
VKTLTDREFDVIVIGSGAGGCAATFALVQAGLRVALVEKGQELPHDGSTLDIDTVVRHGYFKSHESWLDGRGRPFVPEEYFNIGGKTKWYGAALLRYAPSEFLSDPVHECRGWPISHEDLAPYYGIASEQLGIRSFDCEPDLARIANKLVTRSPQWRSEPMPLGLAAGILNNRTEASHFDGFASRVDLKSDAETAFLSYVRHSPTLTLFEGVAVIDLLPHDDGAREIGGVRLADERVLKARCVLLAAGALHSPRLLQRYVERHRLLEASTDLHEIGRNLKLHLLTAMVAISPAVKTDLIRKTRIFLNDELPHSSVQPLGFDGELIATLIPQWVPNRVARYIGRRSYGFFLQTEDGSHGENRVIAPGITDSVGPDSPIMDYEEARSAPALNEHVRLIRRFRTALRRAGLIAFSQRIGLAGTAHANGTLIAGDDPRTSVVDAQGKVHGLKSLYVVDGSVLPRSSRVNPSLTIYAWSLRAASLLAKQLAQSAASMSPLTV